MSIVWFGFLALAGLSSPRSEPQVAGEQTQQVQQPSPEGVSITETNETTAPTLNSPVLGTETVQAPPSPTSTPTPTPTPKPTVAPTPTPTPQTQNLAPPQQQNTGSSWVCNCAKTCPQMSSCAEAQYQLNVCGCGRRDADNDGIACDADCQ